MNVDWVAEMPVTEPLRADARRNRERIITAASELFAENGVDCLVADVARHAGLGNATVFRHFPTKLDLIVAVMERRLTDLVAEARAASAMQDPAAGLQALVEALCRMHVRDHALKQMASQYFQGSPQLIELRDTAMVVLEDLIARGKTAGVVREDAEPIDLIVLIGGIADAASDLETLRPGLWRRYAQLVVAALRPDPTGPPLDPPVPARELLEAMWAAKAAAGDCVPAPPRITEPPA